MEIRGFEPRILACKASVFPIILYPHLYRGFVIHCPLVKRCNSPHGLLELASSYLFGRSDGIRTHTLEGLSLLSLPVGLQTYIGDSYRDRTYNPLIKSQVLWPIELRNLLNVSLLFMVSSAGIEPTTPGLKVRCSTC